MRTQDAVVAVRGDGGEFDPGGLQRTIDLVAGAALAPEGAVDGTFDFKFDFSQAIGRVPRHDVVIGRRDALQPRCLVVERQADGVEQGRFTRAGWAGDGEQVVVGEWRLGEVDAPFAFQRVEVFQAQGEDFHALPLSDSASCRLAMTSR